jgi:hypothetical protein
MSFRLVELTLPGDNSPLAGIAGGKSVGAGENPGKSGVHSGITGERLGYNPLIPQSNQDTDSSNRFLKDLLRPARVAKLWTTGH